MQNEPVPTPPRPVAWTGRILRCIGAIRTCWQALLGLLLATALLWTAYTWGRSELTARLYRHQYTQLRERHRDLRDAYKELVQKTAVTELDVTDGRLTVVVRGATGDLQRVKTPFNPASEIYVDYVILNGRLWIRRVFDEHTPPNQALIIDPGLIEIDWNSDHAQHGEAVYRSLDEGRWTVTVTGNGALGLSKQESHAAAPLCRAPRLLQPTPAFEHLSDQPDTWRPQDILRTLCGLISHKTRSEEHRK